MWYIEYFYKLLSNFISEPLVITTMYLTNGHPPNKFKGY